VSDRFGVNLNKFDDTCRKIHRRKCIQNANLLWEVLLLDFQENVI